MPAFVHTSSGGVVRYNIYMKLLIITQKDWITMRAKTDEIKHAWGLAKNAPPLTVDVEKRALTPEVKDGRITHEWFDTISHPLKGKYDFVLLIIPLKQGNKLDLKDGLRGSTHSDKDGIGEMWVCTDEFTKHRHKNGRRVNRFEKVAIHELSHAVAKLLQQTDNTHIWDYEKSEVSGAFNDYTWGEDTVYPLKAWKTAVSNAFGVEDTIYTKTHSHIGVDHAVPVNTPVYAPFDGEIFKIGSSPEKGNAGIFIFTKEREWGFEICHLNKLPTLGLYKKGDIIAYTGNTGLSTGPHLHSVLHRDAYVTKNYNELFTGEPGKKGRERFLRMVAEGKIVDPTTFFL